MAYGEFLIKVTLVMCLLPIDVSPTSSLQDSVQNVCSAKSTPSCSCAYMVDLSLNVNCSNRQITEVPAKIPLFVAVLLLNNNRIKALKSSSFVGFKDMQTLYLQSNSITSIERGTFDYLYNLKSLVISSNGLTQIYSGMFYHLPNLHTIELSNNLITKLARDSFLTLPNIDTIGFTGNPLVCDCETRAFKQWLDTRTGKTTLLNAACKNIQDTPLTRIADSKFGNCVGDELFSTHSCYSCSDKGSHRDCINALNSQRSCTPGGRSKHDYLLTDSDGVLDSPINEENGTGYKNRMRWVCQDRQ